MPRTCMIGKMPVRLIVGHFFRLVVGEQARHARIAGDKRLDQIGMENRVELALRQHGLDRFVVRQAVNI